MHSSVNWGDPILQHHHTILCLCCTCLSVDEVSVKMSEELILNSLAALNNLSFHATDVSALVRRSLEIAQGRYGWKMKFIVPKT